MTTIVGRPGQLALDSQVTGREKRQDIKYFHKHDYVVAGAGDSACIAACEHLFTWPRSPTVKNLTKWAHTNHSAEKSDLNECEFLIVTKIKLFRVVGRLVYEPEDGIAGIGSGAPYALGYLRANSDDLHGAVAAACFYDPYSCGPIHVVNV